jgi:hypothetical protein
MRIHLWAPLLLIGVLGISAGCNDDDDSGPTEPTAEEADQVKAAFTAANSSNLLVETGSSQIIADGGFAETAGMAAADPASGSFTANISTSVDLATVLGSNATGVVQIDATGSVSGTEWSGDATYDVVVQVDDPDGVLYVHPQTQDTALIADNSLRAYSLSVTWNKTDETHWSVEAQDEGTVTDQQVLLTSGTETLNTSVDANIQRFLTLSQDGGPVSISAHVVGWWEATLQHGQDAANTVRVDFDGLNKIKITINGVVLGTYTLQELHRMFFNA